MASCINYFEPGMRITGIEEELLRQPDVQDKNRKLFLSSFINASTKYLPTSPNNGRTYNQFELIKKRLEGRKYVVEGSENNEKFTESLDNIFNGIVDRINEYLRNFEKEELTEDEKNDLRNRFNRVFTVNPLTKVERAILENLKNETLYTEEDIKGVSFNAVLRDIYGNQMSSLNKVRQDEFDNAMLLCTIINTDYNKPSLITQSSEMNNAIMAYHEAQYDIIKKYLQNQGYDLNAYEVASYLYNKQTKARTKNHYNLFTLMYNVIKDKQQKDIKAFDDQINDGWTKALMKDPEITLYKAINAYINLLYFDQSLDTSLGKYIEVNHNYDSPISTDENGNTVLKYSFAKGNAFAVNTWGKEERDMLKEMSSFSRVLIQAIPVFNYDSDTNTASPAARRMELKDFVNTISMLQDIGTRYTGRQDISQQFMNFMDDTKNSFKTLCSILFSSEGDGARRAFNNLGFDQNYMNYLYSIYRVMFLTDTNVRRSWDAVEQAYMRQNGIPSTYPVINTLLGVMRSSVANNFLQTVYDRTQKRMVTRVKKKFNTNRAKFDLMNNVNQTTIDREDKAQLLRQYVIERRSVNDNTDTAYQVRFNDIILTIEDTPKSGGELSMDGLLGRNHKIITIEIPKKNLRYTLTKNGMNDTYLLKDMTLSNMGTRRNLVSTEMDKLQDSEQALMKVLKFVDDMLMTNFTSEDGLHRIALMQSYKSTNLSDVVASAVRTLFICDLYEKARAQYKDKFSILNIKTYISDNWEKADESKKWYYYNIANIAKDAKKYFQYTKTRGTQLLPIFSGETWLDDYSDAEAILSGETSKSVISNVENNKIPNFSPMYMGMHPEVNINNARRSTEQATYNLLFTKKPYLLRSKVLNMDVITQDGKRKLVKNMTNRELLYDSLVNKFIIPMLDSSDNKTFYVQPTVYADKTKFMVYGIDFQTLQEIFLENGGVLDIKNNENTDKVVSGLLYNTIGKFYQSIWSRVKTDYRKLFGLTELDYTDDEILDYVENRFSTPDANGRYMNTEGLNLLIDQYNAEHPGEHLVLYNETHFREVKGPDGKKRLVMNELLRHYADFLYNNDNVATQDLLNQRLEYEKRKFVQNLIDNRMVFKIRDDALRSQPGEDAYDSDPILSFMRSNFIDTSQWLQGSYMVLAKYDDGSNIISTSLQPDKKITLNPILNFYFMVDTLLGNNTRMLLTGAEINHEMKSYPKVGQEIKNLYGGSIRAHLNLTDDADINLYHIQKVLSDPTFMMDDRIRRAGLMTVYLDMVRKVENDEQKVQIKRNVPIPGPIRPYSRNTITGIRDQMNIAVIDDVTMPIHNFNGDWKTGEKTADGSAYLSPLTSILENNALEDNEVGITKKPLHSYLDHTYGTGSLLKYAVYTMTNQWMITSEGNNLQDDRHGIRLYKIFKKMHNVRWRNEEALRRGERGIDLINGCDFKSGNSKIDFFNNICGKEAVYYDTGKTIENRSVLHKIVDLRRTEDGIYYTVEQRVDIYGNPLDRKDVQNFNVYHYFDENSNHIRTYQKLSPQEQVGYHTIDSLFELHSTFGGIYSMSMVDGVIRNSEISNKIVANYMNYVAYKLDRKAELYRLSIDQNNFFQPLKRMLIDVVANKTSMKNGVGNINATTSFYDDTPLRYITMDTMFYGTQQDSEHDVDESEMTEFSQVMNALDSGGQLHGYVSQVYDALAQITEQLSALEIEAANEVRTATNPMTMEQAKNKLYDLIVRTLMNNMSRRDSIGLANAILQSMEKEFNSNVNHANDKTKVPFSDPNIYTKLLSTFVSVINKKSIKRKYSGLGATIAPSYDMSMIYEIQGKTYMFQDIIRMARAAGITSEATDPAEYNRDIAKQFLAQEQQNPIYVIRDITSIKPEDNLLVTVQAEGFNLSGINTDQVDYEIVHKPWRSNPEKSNLSLRLYVKGHREYGYFELVKDSEAHYYSVHFKTGDADTGETYGSSTADRQLLYNNLIAALPVGAFVSTYGNVSAGGLTALQKIGNAKIGNSNVFISQGERLVVNRVTGAQTQIPIYQKVLSTSENQPAIQSFDLHVSLTSIKDYYSFTENPRKFLTDKYGLTLMSDGITNPEDVIRIRKDVTRPRNLAPTFIQWSYEDQDGSIHEMNFFQHPDIKNMYNMIFDAEERGEKPDKAAIHRIYNPQKVLNDLANGTDGIDTHKRVFNIRNNPAELIVSNIYMSAFGMHEYNSLAEVMDRGEVAFIQIPRIPVTHYDLAFTRQNDKHLYITFGTTPNSDSFDASYRRWGSTVLEEFTIDGKKPEEHDSNVKFKVYAITRDNIRLFEVGRYIVADGVTWDAEQQVYKDNEGNVIKKTSRYKRWNNQVLEYVEFLSKYNVEETSGNDGNQRTLRYAIYNINRKNVARAFNRVKPREGQLRRTNRQGETYEITEEQLFNEQIDNFISTKLLAKIYQSSDFNGIRVNDEPSAETHKTFSRILYNLGNELSYNTELHDFLINTVLERIKNTKPDNQGKIKYKLSRSYNAYFMSLAHKKYMSFLKSLQFTSARIPSQELQSFMMMNAVGFTGNDKNLAYVSRWQTWIQGSDYDIDKAYLMGMAFDGNGMYIGWSNLFDYSSLRAIKASEDLQMPRKIVYKQVQTEEDPNWETAVDITSFVRNALDIQNRVVSEGEYTEDDKRVDRMTNYVNLINLLYSGRPKRGSTVYVKFDTSDEDMIKTGHQVLRDLGTHEFTTMPTDLQEGAVKNFVSSHVQNVVQDLRNMIRAYTPIVMDEFREASEQSPKGKESQEITFMNPATKFYMQAQAVMGKNGVGIAANGMKGYFMWQYYLNDIYKHPDEDNLKYADFKFSTKRIYKRASEQGPQEITVTLLPEVNFENVDPRIREERDGKGTRIINEVPASFMISQIISGATDNMKELILPNINAGTKMMKMYLFLTALGFDMNDVVKFLTSPVASVLNDLTEDNVFTGEQMDFNGAYLVLEGKYDALMPKDFRYRLQNLSELDYMKDRGINDEVEFALLQKGIMSDRLRDAINSAMEADENTYRAHVSFLNDFMVKVNSVRNLFAKYGLNVNPDGTLAGEDLQDLEEFKMVMEGANEFSFMAQALSINQGIPTTKIDLQKKVKSLQNLYERAIKNRKGEIEDPALQELDVVRFFTDREYAHGIKEQYDMTKKVLNPFAIMDRIPHFRAMFGLLATAITMDHYTALKTQVYNTVFKQLYKEDPYMTERFMNNMLDSIDKYFITMFLETLDYKIPYPKGVTLMYENRSGKAAKVDDVLVLDSMSSIATFKSLFENVIIPGLKRGVIYQWDPDTKTVKEQKVDGLDQNPFIKSLVRTYDNDMPMYKTDINLTTLTTSNDSRIRMQRYLKGFRDLDRDETRINGIPLIDLFMLYNIITNKNMYGADRLTTMFDTFVVENPTRQTLMDKYLKFISELDFYGSISEADGGLMVKYRGPEGTVLEKRIMAEDIMLDAAPIVYSQQDQKDPMIKINSDMGLQIYRRHGWTYDLEGSMIPVISGETAEDYASRLYNDGAYFVLGGKLSGKVDRLVSTLRESTDTDVLYSAVNELARYGTMFYLKVC